MIDLLMRRREMEMPQGEAPIPIPEDAVRIEYVANTSNVRLNTGYIPTDASVIKIKYMPVSLTSDATFGYYINDSRDFRFFNTGGRIFFDAFSGKRIYSGTGKQVVNTLYELEFGNFYVKDLTTGSIIISSNTPYSGTGEGSLWLNAYNHNIGAAKNRWYYLKMYESGVLKMYLIPIRIESVGYLYDAVSQQTITPSTGSWALGPDL